MDSAGNSGSLNSTSGGDDEYDSRTESLPTFFTSSNQQPPLPPLNPHNHHTSSTFDHHHHLFNFYFDSTFSLSPPTPTTTTTTNSLQNLDMVWPKNLMSTLSSSTQLSYGSAHQIHFSDPPPSSISLKLAGDHENSATNKGTTSSDHQPITTSSPTRPNPKKRSRASRRAPTTVLTTDTSNFRAMVQEFTGIPALPFSAPSSLTLFPRRRLDLFNTSTTMKSGHLETQSPPPYHLRTFHSDSLLQNDHHQSARNLPIFVDKSKEPELTISSNNSKLKNGHELEEFSMINNHGSLSNIVTTTTSNEMSSRNYENRDHHQNHLHG